MPFPQQLIEQAETISSLSRQRDFLVSRSEQESERWGAEQEGWLRMAGALAERSMRDETVRADVSWLLF
jgi:hypothetical protein